MKISVFFLFLGLSLSVFSQSGKEIRLWESKAPGAKGTSPEDIPTLSVFEPDDKQKNGMSVVICPGGGYSHLAINHEGYDVAHWLNSLGITAFVLKYRHDSRERHYRYPVPFLDASRAMRLIRTRASEFGISPERIGIMGFSAGGHLASSVGTHADNGIAPQQATDSIDQTSNRPNFMILIYPVISFTTKYTHRGSRWHFLGVNINSKLAEDFSNEKQVTSLTPPTFLVHADNDHAVPVENSILFYSALKKAGVPAEMHIYAKGGHGFGMAPEDSVLGSWPQRLADWLKSAPSYK